MPAGNEPPKRLLKGVAANLERIYQGLGRLLGALLQPLAWLLDLLAPDAEHSRRRAAWWRANYLAPVFWLAGPLGLFWLWLIVTVAVNLAAQLTDPIPGADDPPGRRAYFYGVGLTITGLGALLAAPFVLIRAWINERQAQTAERQAATAESGQITDRFTKAIDQLGSEQMAVRLGAIYALERIAEDSERDHIPIMETLCAFIRENANRDVDTGKMREIADLPDELRPDWKALTEEERDDARKKIREHFGPARPLRADVQAAFAVIGRRREQRRRMERERKPEPFRLDFRRANLQGLDLSGLDFAHADLRETRLEGASLRGAKMEGADLTMARMEGANLKWANLRSANLWDCYIARTSLRSADLRETTNLTQAAVKSAFGDRETQLPKGIEMPEDWKTRHPILAFQPDPDYDAWLTRQGEAGTPGGAGA